MAKITLQDIISGYNSTTKINANNAALISAFDNTVSRNGQSPNTMLADFDMNSHKIVNLAAPSSPTDAARLADVTGTIVFPTAPAQTGNSGKFLTTDGTNMSWATVPASGIPRTAEESLAGIFPSNILFYPGDVRRYGAVPDPISGLGGGATDSTSAFTAAAAAYPLGAYIPDGYYKLTGTVTGTFYVFGGVQFITGGVTTLVNILSLLGSQITQTQVNITATWDQGFTTTPTATIQCIRVGKQVSLIVPAVSLTGGGGAGTLYTVDCSTIPAEFIPPFSSGALQVVPNADDGGGSVTTYVNFNRVTKKLVYQKSTGATWSTSGIKGVNATHQYNYCLV